MKTLIITIVDCKKDKLKGFNFEDIDNYNKFVYMKEIENLPSISDSEWKSIKDSMIKEVKR